MFTGCNCGRGANPDQPCDPRTQRCNCLVSTLFGVCVLQASKATELLHCIPCNLLWMSRYSITHNECLFRNT